MIYHLIFSNHKEIMTEDKEALAIAQYPAKDFKEAVEIAKRHLIELVKEGIIPKYAKLIAFIPERDIAVPIALFKIKPVNELFPDYYFSGDEK